MLISKMRDILDGRLQGDSAIEAVRKAIIFQQLLLDEAHEFGVLIKQAEDRLLYGQLGRPSSSCYR
jgi:hypothetical protein